MCALSDRVASIRRRIEDACRAVGRDPQSVTLIAVTKTVPLAAIRAAYELGLRDFGESRLQEALPKIDALPPDIVWHFIGKLQSNKAKKVAGAFTVVHTVESDRQCLEMDKAGSETQALIEVNVAREPQKAGIFPEDLDATLRVLSHSRHVRCRGLMTMGPQVSDPEQSRPVFRELSRLARVHGAEWLSMGMSADFDVAIQEGATHVRVGSALFGERD